MMGATAEDRAYVCPAGRLFFRRIECFTEFYSRPCFGTIRF